jgi:hypothetical protein
VLAYPPLSFGRASQSPVEVPDTRSSSVQTWRAADGAVVAVGHTVNGTHWMHWPGLGSFAITARGRRVIAYPCRGAHRELVEDTYQRSVLPIALQAFGAEALHASAVHIGRGVVGFFATSETGKSTLAFELAKRGYAQWSDDSLVFDTGCSDPTVFQLPFRVRLGGSSGTASPRTSTLPMRAPVTALFLLERAQLTGPDPASIEPLAGAHAFAALLEHAHCFETYNAERRARMVHFFLDVVTRVPTLKLRFRPDLSGLPRVVDAVEHAITALGNSAGSNN